MAVQIQGGSNSAGKANVDAGYHLKVALPTDDAYAGKAIMTSENDAGSTYLVSPESTDDYRLRVGVDSMLTDRLFNYVAQDTEIGALIGAVVVWTFLWGNGETFGTAGTTLNWLDVAAPYGIMATAVALLMIGGEFDLSSGLQTGGAAMVIGLMSRFFTGTGVHIGIAILAAFAAMVAIGWFNGYMVNRTGLPSFIITLASFFVMRGLMLVLSSPSGAGKTSLTYLIPRLYDPEAGEVLLDDIPLKDIQLESLSRIVGAVTQETYLMHTSIRENLQTAKPGASQSELEEACREAKE